MARKVTKTTEVFETETVIGAGKTKITGVTAGRSGLWQQDIEHVAIAGMLCSQSIAFRAAPGACRA